jgi:hypothetical protein
MQIWGTNQAGGYAATPSIDYTLRQRATKSTFFQQFTLGLNTYGKHRADRLFYNKLGRMITPLSTSGLGESDPIPESNFAINQGQVVVTEYANSVAWTERLDTFSQFSIGQMVGMVLRQDQIEQLDKVANAAYATGKTIYTPLTATQGAFSTTGTPAAVAGAAMSVQHLRDVTDNLRFNAIPPLVEGDYLGICHIDHARSLKESNELIETSKYAQPERLFRSEIGRYAAARIVEENNVLTSPAGTNTAGLAEAFYIGADNVLEAVAQAPHLRYGIPVDFGRDRREASFFMGGYSLVWNFAVDGEEHQIHVTSS